MRFGDAGASEDVGNFADRDDNGAVFFKLIENGRWWDQGEVAAVGGALEVAGGAKEGTGDDATNAQALFVANRASGLANLVEAFERE